MQRDRGFQKFSPVKVGDELDVKIEAVGEKGDGIAKKEGFVLFVPNTKEGQEVKIKVTKVLRKVGFAEVVGEGQSSSKQEQAKGSKEEREPAAEESEESEDENLEDSEDFGEEESTDE
jgi:predicted RNA-binding protein with TRAM domain